MTRTRKASANVTKWVSKNQTGFKLSESFGAVGKWWAKKNFVWEIGGAENCQSAWWPPRYLCSMHCLAASHPQKTRNRPNPSTPHHSKPSRKWCCASTEFVPSNWPAKWIRRHRFRCQGRKNWSRQESLLKNNCRRSCRKFFEIGQKPRTATWTAGIRMVRFFHFWRDF